MNVHSLLNPSLSQQLLQDSKPSGYWNDERLREEYLNEHLDDVAHTQFLIQKQEQQEAINQAASITKVRYQSTTRMIHVANLT